MRKLYPAAVIFIIVCAIVSTSWAQMPFNEYDSIDINNINARILVHGDMFWDPVTGVSACEFPKGSGKHINFASTLWMSGYDGAGQLHIAAQTYRQDGNDYWPGPIDLTGTISYTASHNWSKIWKVERADIQYFLSLTTHTIINTSHAILTWPGKGNSYAEGNSGAPLSLTNDMAPFIDLNSNGIYEPLLGEYPDIKGDEALWWIFNDNGPAHTQTSGLPLGVEIHAMAFAYKRNTLIDNVIYFDYTVHNRSANNYSNFRLGLFDDVDLGYAFDDYIGFDSTWRMGICYNGINSDGGSGGHPVNSYGTHIPTVGITMIVLPGDAGATYVPTGSYVYYNNDFSIIGNPAIDSQFDHYLRARIRDGQHFSYDFAGPGVPSKGYGTGPLCNYVYTGDPSVPTEWSECICDNVPSDRRFIITSNDFTLNAGSSQHIVMALVTTNPDSSNGCPGARFDSIKVVADTAWKDYYNPLPPLPAGIDNANTQNIANIFPNPAHDQLFIETSTANSNDATVVIYNTLGQTMDVPALQKGNQQSIDISRLPPGLYYAIYRTGEAQTPLKFVKD
jgi:hypothetical protein